jgi:winged helix DNA-binding protein
VHNKSHTRVGAWHRFEAPVTLRELNRATLARQLLLERVDLSAVDTIAHLAGMQGQDSSAPYIGLWSRLAGFRRDELTRAVERGDVVRSSLMRLTIHLATADDFRWLRPTLAPMLEQKARGRARLLGADLRAIEQAARRRLATGPATMVELRALADPTLDKGALADFLHAHIPFTHVPPSGTWRFNGRSLHARADDLATPELGRLVVRYLQAFGPATVRDIQAWSGLTRLRAAVDGLGDRLLELQGDDGVTYYDLPDAPRPPAEQPAPVRFLPVWDNLLFAHADRTRVIPDGLRPVDVIGKPTYLVDGVVAGTWRWTGECVELEPNRASDARLQDEAERLRRWLRDP